MPVISSTVYNLGLPQLFVIVQLSSYIVFTVLSGTFWMPMSSTMKQYVDQHTEIIWFSLQLEMSSKCKSHIIYWEKVMPDLHWNIKVCSIFSLYQFFISWYFSIFICSLNTILGLMLIAVLCCSTANRIVCVLPLS